MAEEEDYLPEAESRCYKLRLKCAATHLFNPSTVATFTCDLAPTGYVQKEAPSIGGYIKSLYECLNTVAVELVFTALFAPVRGGLWLFKQSSQHLDPKKLPKEFEYYDAYAAYVIADLSGRIYLEEPETWHSRQPSDNSDKDHYADKVTSPENLSLSCKQLLGLLKDSGVPGPYPGVKLLSDAKFNVGDIVKFKADIEDRTKTEHWYNCYGTCTEPPRMLTCSKGAETGGKREELAKVAKGSIVINHGILRYDAKYNEMNAFIVEYRDASGDMSKDWLAVVFRGTKSGKDMGTDTDIGMSHYATMTEDGKDEDAAELDTSDPDRKFGDVHNGFYTVLLGIQEGLFEVLKEALQDGRHPTIYFGGHSLGGAMATLSAFDFAVHLDRGLGPFKNLPVPTKPRIGVYSFGSPRVGDETFTKSFTKYMKKFGGAPAAVPVPRPVPADAEAKAGSGVVASPSDTVEAPAPEPAPAPAPAPASDQAPLQKREEMAVSDSAPSPEGPPGGKEDGTKFWRSGGLAPAPDEEEPAADEEGETSAKTANAGEGEGVCLGVSDVLAYRHVYEVDIVPQNPPFYYHVHNEIICERDGIKTFKSARARECLGLMVSWQSTVFQRAASHGMGNYMLATREILSWDKRLTLPENRKVIERAGPLRLFGQGNPGPSTIRAFLSKLKDCKVDDHLAHSLLGLMYMFEREHKRPWAKQELSYALHLCTETTDDMQEFYRDAGIVALYFISYDYPVLDGRRSCVETSLGIITSCNPSSLGQRTGYMSMTAPPSLLGCGLCGDAQEDAERLFFSFVAEAIFGSREKAELPRLLLPSRDIVLEVSKHALNVARHRFNEALKKITGRGMQQEADAKAAAPASPVPAKTATEKRAAAEKKAAADQKAAGDRKGPAAAAEATALPVQFFDPKVPISLDEAVIVVSVARAMLRRQLEEEAEGRAEVEQTGAAATGGDERVVLLPSADAARESDAGGN